MLGSKQSNKKKEEGQKQNDDEGEEIGNTGFRIKVSKSLD